MSKRTHLPSAFSGPKIQLAAEPNPVAHASITGTKAALSNLFGPKAVAAQPPPPQRELPPATPAEIVDQNLANRILQLEATLARLAPSGPAIVEFPETETPPRDTITPKELETVNEPSTTTPGVTAPDVETSAPAAEPPGPLETHIAHPGNPNAVLHVPTGHELAAGRDGEREFIARELADTGMTIEQWAEMQAPVIIQRSPADMTLDSLAGWSIFGIVAAALLALDDNA